MAARTLLVVEDDEDLRSIFKTSLALAGYDVREARNGFEALRSLDAVIPDLVILDLGLPVMSGHTVLEEITAQAHTRYIPVMIVTALPDRIDKDVACIMRKPVLHDELIDAVERCLAAPARPAGA